jgi:hypothetical protein
MAQLHTSTENRGGAQRSKPARRTSACGIMPRSEERKTAGATRRRIRQMEDGWNGNRPARTAAPEYFSRLAPAVNRG